VIGITSESVIDIASEPVIDIASESVIDMPRNTHSDVNLATHLLLDGFRRDYECAVVVSNDSDLLEPIRVVRCELGPPVGLINPHRHPSAALVSQATFIKQIRPGLLAKCQLPDTLTDANGVFHKPLVW
jgi:hypothetical protein